MTLSEVKNHLKQLKKLYFQLPDGSLVPNHFHVTEIGLVTKQFIDCGGTLRNEQVINFQLWNANDYDHRLHPEKLLHIISLSEHTLKLDNLNIEVEYQIKTNGIQTIGKFGLSFANNRFLLTQKQTDCLAQNQCGIPEKKPKIKLSSLTPESCCAPNGNCC